MERNNIFTRTKADNVTTGVMYYDPYAAMSFWDFGEPITCFQRDVLDKGTEKKISKEKLLTALNHYERIKYCHSYGEVIDLREQGLDFHAMVTGQSTHMTSGVSKLLIEIVPEYNFTPEQMDYLFKTHTEKLDDVRIILLDIKHTYRSELIERMKEVIKNWDLIHTYQSLIPKDYYIQPLDNGYEVFNEFNKRIFQRTGCSKKFKTLKEAIKFLWTVEITGAGWEKVRNTKDIPLDIKRKIQELAA